MKEIITLLGCITPIIERKKQRQLTIIIEALLSMRGRITMLGLSRWSERGGSYRTITRFFSSKIDWASINWFFIKQHLVGKEKVYLLAGDEVVVSKSGKKSYGLDRFYSSIINKPIKSLAFLHLSMKTVVKPNIYALVIGIEEFRNPTLKLDYPQEDAKLFGEIINVQKGGIFDKVFVTTLDTKESTTKENILAQLEKFKSVGKNDIFILYISSRGTVYKGEYFLITSNVGSLSNDRLKDEALSGHSIQKRISNIPALKKLMVFDTCYAGALGDILGKTIKTKGLSEKRAIDVLSYASGSAILSTSTSSEEAIANGYQGHSIFTYILVDGLKGKADGGRKDGFINTAELASYLDEEVPLISKHEFTHEQFPVNNTDGQAFSVSRVE